MLFIGNKWKEVISTECVVWKYKFLIDLLCEMSVILGSQVIHFSKVHEVCITCAKSHVDPKNDYLLVGSGIIQNNL